MSQTSTKGMEAVFAALNREAEEAGIEPCADHRVEEFDYIAENGARVYGSKCAACGGGMTIVSAWHLSRKDVGL